MTTASRLTGAVLAGAMGLVWLAPLPAGADGAASTRNILFGTAAAAGGTLLIINHNKKVHQKYAEYDRQQAALQAENSNTEAAYHSERQAYQHEAQLVSDYQRENAYQHKVVLQQNRQIAQLEHSLTLAQRAGGLSTGFVQPARVQPAPGRPAIARDDSGHPQGVSYGWGNL
ncbi:MAG: hypothetical protein ACLPYS_17145 [Vulcanimicrobiaceae bacterium]